MLKSVRLNGFCLCATLNAAVAATTSPQHAQAQGSSSIADSVFGNKHLISIGGARQEADAFIRATAGDANPVSLSIEDLGIDDQDGTFFFEYRYRATEKWTVLAGGYTFSGSGSRTSERDFNYDGVDFTLGSTISSELGVDAYIVDALYRVYQSDTLEIDLGGGVHALDLSASISAELTVGDIEASEAVAGTTLLAPVPNFRAAATWMLGERIGLRFVGGWLSANIDDYEGSFSYGHIRGFYSFNENLGVSLGYQVTDVDIIENRERSVIEYDVALEGPTLTFTLSF
ncbi:MAG: hypothetical protein AAGG55_04155 [Pseudomonadota bacterium]